MFSLALSDNLFQNGGEAYTYSELKIWLMNHLGLTPHQAAGTVGSCARWGYITVASYAADSIFEEAIFTR